MPSVPPRATPGSSPTGWCRRAGSSACALVSPSFFSFGTACTYHGLTEQAFAEVYIACHERRRPLIVRGKRYVFVEVPPRRFFGFQEITVLGEPVQMATLERSVLDALDRPQHAGGLGEVSRIVARASTRISWPVLLELARKWESSALVQRLGYLLDLHHAHVPDDARAKLLGLTRPASKIHCGPRAKWGTSGKLVRPWNIVENVPRDALISSTDRPRRRVVFQTKGNAS
jgi:predicted transcriptional regulator of viral defense system